MVPGIGDLPLKDRFEQWLLFRDEFTHSLLRTDAHLSGRYPPTRRLGLVADATRELDLAIADLTGRLRRALLRSEIDAASGPRWTSSSPGSMTTSGTAGRQLQDASRVGFQGIRSEAKRLVDVTEAAP